MKAPSSFSDALRAIGPWWLAAYAVTMLVVGAAMFFTRASTLETMSTPQAKAEWEAWRAAAQEQTGDEGPVKRRAPESSEPPALVLMRDYFGVLLFGALFFSTLLFVAMMIAIRGVLTHSKPIR